MASHQLIINILTRYADARKPFHLGDRRSLPAPCTFDLPLISDIEPPSKAPTRGLQRLPDATRVVLEASVTVRFRGRLPIQSSEAATAPLVQPLLKFQLLAVREYCIDLVEPVLRLLIAFAKRQREPERRLCQVLLCPFTR